MPAETIAIMAAGVVTPIGADLDTFWAGLQSGSDGVTRIERFRVDDLRVGRGGEIKKLPAVTDGVSTPCRASRLLVAAAHDLLDRTTLDASPRRIGVVVGTALGGVEELERAVSDDRRLAPAVAALYDSPAHALARQLGVDGPVMTVSTACASGATALGMAADLLYDDAADLVVAGGYDVLCRFVMRGFDALRSLTRERVRPFDRRRSGLLLGEGAGLVLLARERDVRGPRLGRLRGHASISDGTHVAAPDPEGGGLERAVRHAMADADVTAAEIEFVSAHGTATPLNDKIEAAVLRRVLGTRAVPVNSIKGALGHTMGAAATLEAIMALLAARDGVIPSTLGLDEPDPACELDHVMGGPRAVRPRVILSTSAGFGGCNAALVLEGAPRGAAAGVAA